MPYIITFSILTPSHRPQLLTKCFEQIDKQTYGAYEHLVALDRKGIHITTDNPRRKLIKCNTEHRNWGNTCRNMLGLYAKNNIIIYADDDDVFLPNCLERLAFNIENNPEYVWGYSKTYINSNTIDEKTESFPNNLDSSNLLSSSLTLNQIFHRRIIDGKPVRYYEGPEYIGDKLTIGQYLIYHKPLKINEILTLHGRYSMGKDVEEWRK